MTGSSLIRKRRTTTGDVDTRERGAGKRRTPDTAASPPPARSGTQSGLASRLLALLETRGIPMSPEALLDGLDRAPRREVLDRTLESMRVDGQVILNRRGEWGLVGHMGLVRGRVQGHRDGFGFLVPEEGGPDVFLSSRQMRSLMHGDRALVRVVSVDRQGRREGSLVEVVERATSSIVGRFWRERGIGFVRPDNARYIHDVLVEPENAAGARDGQMVVVEILEQPDWRAQPVGRVTEVLGDHMAPGMEIEVAIRAYDLPDAFPEAVLAEAAAFGARVPRGAVAGREDLRALPLVTIDGDDARDFDDAVHCRPTASGWKLTVAIADVGAYVRPATALDEEARLRGTSVYFPNRVLPMLPEALSNGLCSLVPDEDRLCVACEMLVRRDGTVTRARFLEGVMRSHARLTYDEVAAIVVRRDADAREARAALVPHLDALNALYHALRVARERRGAVDFETTETRFLLGVDGKIAGVEPVVRHDAHRIIEECMISANVAAARLLERRRLPGMFRVHETPTREKLAELRAFLKTFGLRLAGGPTPQPEHYAAVAERVKGRPEADLVQTVLLRSMPQAVYATRNVGHFGLALATYTHFTSPIRRYPDLVVHRAIKGWLLDAKRTDRAGEPALAALADHCSMTERRADEATRDAAGRLKCEFMAERLGEVHDGIVSGVTGFGLFVTLAELPVDGLVHISGLGSDYFQFDRVHHVLVGERSGRRFRLGDRLRVRVLRADADSRRIDFELADRPTGTTRREPRGPTERGERAPRGGRRRGRRGR
ncbi:MAG: ribonuclease R [Chromatiales bacterium]|nr:ribonuclease R [Chromatiales bacterium]